MYQQYELPSKTRFWLGAVTEGHVPAFCAFDYIANFRRNGDTYGQELPVKKVKDQKEAALDFIQQEIKRFARGSKLLIADRVDSGFHEYLTPNLPKTFTATNSQGKKVDCRVVREDSYTNLNTGEEVQEVYIYMTKTKAPVRKRSIVNRFIDE